MFELQIVNGDTEQEAEQVAEQVAGEGEVPFPEMNVPKSSLTQGSS